MIAIVFTCLLLFIIVLAIISILNKNGTDSTSYKKIDSWDTYDANQKQYNKAVRGGSKEVVEEAISNFNHLKSITPDQYVRSQYDSDIAAMRSRLNEKWQIRADRYLQKLSDEFYLITDCDMHDFKDVDYLFKAKASCLSTWKKYYELDPKRFGADENPKRYMREWFGSEYDPCMDTYESFERKLNELTDHMVPVLNRKKNISRLIVSYVREEGSVKRTDLFRHQFEDCNDNEFRCCYRELIKKNRLVEVKIGSRIFVTIPGKKGETENTVLSAYEEEFFSKLDRKKYSQKVPVPMRSESDAAEADQWFKKVGKHLGMFGDCYTLILEGKPETGYSGEFLLRVKDRCIHEWQAYFFIGCNEAEYRVNLKMYMRDWMGRAYDPCMADHYSLEKKLINKVKQLRPETVRIRKLYDEICAIVKKEDHITRDDLLRTGIDGYSDAELDSALKGLIRSGQLMEKKINGNLIMVCTDKAD